MLSDIIQLIKKIKQTSKYNILHVFTLEATIILLNDSSVVTDGQIQQRPRDNNELEGD